MKYLFILLLLLASCSPRFEEALGVATKTETNAKVTQSELNTKYPGVVAANAATLYPAKESTDTKTEVTKGNTDQLKQNLQKANARADSLQKYANTLPVKAECEPEVLARDRIINALRATISTLNSQAANLRADKERTVITQTKELTSKIAALQYQSAEWKRKYLNEVDRHTETKQELKISEQERITLRWAIGITIGLFVVAILLKGYLAFTRKSIL